MPPRRSQTVGRVSYAHALLYAETGNPFNVVNGCSLDRIAVPCSQAMQAANKALKKLSKTDISFTDLGPIEGVALNDGSGKHRFEGLEARTVDDTVLINTYGSFTTGSFRAFNLPKPVPVAELQGMTPAQNAAYILFHELGHLMKVYDKKYQNDKGNDEAIDANNRLIMENCFKDVKQ